MQRKVIFIIACILFYQIGAGAEEAIPIKKLGIGFDTLGFYDSGFTGLSVKYYFSETWGNQGVFLVKYDAEGNYTLAGGLASIINLYRFDAFLIQFSLEISDKLQYYVSDSLRNNTLSVLLNVGFEYFPHPRFSIGSKIGYGFGYFNWEYNPDYQWRFDLKVPSDVFGNFLVLFPIHFYF